MREEEGGGRIKGQGMTQRERARERAGEDKMKRVKKGHSLMVTIG